jgi:hypothetical protein
MNGSRRHPSFRSTLSASLPRLSGPSSPTPAAVIQSASGFPTFLSLEVDPEILAALLFDRLLPGGPRLRSLHFPNPGGYIEERHGSGTS